MSLNKHSSQDLPPCSTCKVFFYGLCVVCGGNRKRAREEIAGGHSSGTDQKVINNDNQPPVKRRRISGGRQTSSSGGSSVTLVDNLRFITPGIYCSDASLFKELYYDSAKSLRANKKLRLVLDLDETCIHAFKWKQRTKDVVTTNIQLDADERNGLIINSSGRVMVSQAKEKYHKLPLPAEEYNLDFFDMETESYTYRVFVRPHLREFLVALQNDFEIFIYSHGTQEYVENIIRRLGVSQFVQGILGRFDRRTVKKKKSLCRLLSQKTCSVVVDDKKHVWNKRDRDNVVQIPRYSGEKYDSALILLKDMLLDLHKDFYAQNKKDVRPLIKQLPDLDLDLDLLDFDLAEESQDEASSTASTPDSDSEEEHSF